LISSQISFFPVIEVPEYLNLLTPSRKSAGNILLTFLMYTVLLSFFTNPMAINTNKIALRHWICPKKFTINQPKKISGFSATQDFALMFTEVPPLNPTPSLPFQTQFTLFSNTIPALPTWIR
jgi:hypothetical protein